MYKFLVAFFILQPIWLNASHTVHSGYRFESTVKKMGLLDNGQKQFDPQKLWRLR